MAKSMEITLYGDVGWEIRAADFAEQIKAAKGVEELTLRINSFGGDVFEGLTIYQRAAEFSGRVIVKIDGIAASIASVIAMSGSEIHIADHGVVMIHDAWTISAGNAKQLRETAERLEAASSQIANIYQRRTRQPMDKIRKWMDDETEFSAKEAVNFGFASSIMEAERMAAKWVPERHLFKRPPGEAIPPKPPSARTVEAAKKIAYARMQVAQMRA